MQVNVNFIHFNLNSIQLHSISTPFNSISCVQCSCALWNSLTVCRTLIVPTRVNSILLNPIQFHRPQRTAMSTSVPLNQSPDISDPLYQPADLPLSLSIYLPIYPSTNHTHLQCAHTMSSSHYNCCSNNKDRTGLPMHICTFLYSGCLLQPVPA